MYEARHEGIIGAKIPEGDLLILIISIDLMKSRE
jgi:hypothetical protein